jgi:hypothetical protein
MTLEKWFLLPVVLHFFMVFAIGGMMGRARFKAARSGRVKRDDVVSNNNNWPDDVRKFGSNFSNQFEVPMLWYALTAFVLITKLVDPVFVILSWMFLLSRGVHSFIHLTSNKLPDRFYAFLACFFVLAAAWVWFAIRYFSAA